MSEKNHLIMDTPAGGVVRFTLHRPDKMNALATPLLADLANAMENADKDENIRVIIITGGDKIFAAGADINELKTKTKADGLADPRTEIWARIRAIKSPVIAAVEGWCLGAGNELLMCADLAIAGEGAKFGQPETSLGIMPGAGGASTLPRLVGRMQAMKMVLLGRPISAAQALQFGLICDVTPDGAAGELALEYAQKISRRAPLALREAKAVIKATFEKPHSEQLGLERQAFSRLLSTYDKNEGIDAFLDKRKPNWSGR